MSIRRALLLITMVILLGCSRTTAPEPESPGTPEPAPVDEPWKQPPTPVAEPGGSIDERMKVFFEAYYDARRQGDLAAVERMTGGAYQERAATTLGIVEPPERVVEVVAWYGDIRGPSPEPTVVHERNGVRGALTFRLEPIGNSWRIVDLLDPASGRWLSDQAASQPLPPALSPSLAEYIRTFYAARSFTSDNRSTDGLYELADGAFANYVRNAIRSAGNQSEQYEVQAISAIEWVPGEAGAGVADLQVSRTLTRVDAEGNTITETGHAQLRVRYDGAKWQVFDSFIAEEGAWVSTLAWKGIFVAA